MLSTNLTEQSCRHERSQCSDDQTLCQKTLKNYFCTTKPSTPSSNHHQTDETRRSRFYTRAGTHHHHRPICSISHPVLFAQLLFKRPQPTLDTNQSTDEAGFKPGYATTETTYSRSSNSDREPLSGTSRSGSQPSTSGRHSAQWSTVAYVRSCGSRNHTNRYLQSSATKSDQQFIQTSKSEHFHLERRTNLGDPLRTLPSTFLFNSLLQHSTQQTSGTEVTSLQSQVRRRHVSHHRLTQAHDHHAGRPHHSYNGTRPATTHHEKRKNL